MRRLALVVSIFVLSAVGASAADLPAQPYTKAPAVAAPVYDWTGFYAGASIGGRATESNWTTDCLAIPCGFTTLLPQRNPQEFNSSSVRGGIFGGYNWQLSPKWVVGVEGDFAWANSSKSVLGIPGAAFFGAPFANFSQDSSRVESRWDAGIRGRVGFLATPGWLVFGTGGVSWLSLRESASCTAQGLAGGAWCLANRAETYEKILTGWTVGGGLEGKVWQNWLVRAEYRYADYGRHSFQFFGNAPIDTVGGNISVRTHTGLLGLAYQFGGPVVARY